MRTVGNTGASSISLHKNDHVHPIFDPTYARENLVSLAQTLVMGFMYFSIFALLLHWFVMEGYIETQTIPWALIEGSTDYLLYRLPENLIYDKLSIALAIITTIVAARLVRRSFEILKADIQPGKKKKIKKDENILFQLH